jgi:carbon-monoxide dehydrogenase medium subunit
MKPPPFRYHDPKTVGETVALLDRLENAKLLAGGQSLMPMLNFRFVQPDHIIDINRVEGLSYIRESGGALEIGAMTRQRDLEFSDLVRARWPIMHEALDTGRRATAAPSVARSAISTRRRSSSRSRPVTTRR